MNPDIPTIAAGAVIASLAWVAIHVLVIAPRRRRAKKVRALQLAIFKRIEAHATKGGRPLTKNQRAHLAKKLGL